MRRAPSHHVCRAHYRLLLHHRCTSSHGSTLPRATISHDTPIFPYSVPLRPPRPTRQCGKECDKSRADFVAVSSSPFSTHGAHTPADSAAVAVAVMQDHDLHSDAADVVAQTQSSASSVCRAKARCSSSSADVATARVMWSALHHCCLYGSVISGSLGLWVRRQFHALLRARATQAALRMYERLACLGVQLRQSDLLLMMTGVFYDGAAGVAMGKRERSGWTEYSRSKPSSRNDSSSSTDAWMGGLHTSTRIAKGDWQRRRVEWATAEAQTRAQYAARRYNPTTAAASTASSSQTQDESSSATSSTLARDEHATPSSTSASPTLLSSWMQRWMWYEMSMGNLTIDDEEDCACSSFCSNAIPNDCASPAMTDETSDAVCAHMGEDAEKVTAALHAAAMIEELHVMQCSAAIAPVRLHSDEMYSLQTPASLSHSLSASLLHSMRDESYSNASLVACSMRWRRASRRDVVLTTCRTALRLCNRVEGLSHRRSTHALLHAMVRTTQSWRVALRLVMGGHAVQTHTHADHVVCSSNNNDGTMRQCAVLFFAVAASSCAMSSSPPWMHDSLLAQRIADGPLRAIRDASAAELAVQSFWLVHLCTLLPRRPDDFLVAVSELQSRWGLCDAPAHAAPNQTHSLTVCSSSGESMPSASHSSRSSTTADMAVTWPAVAEQAVIRVQLAVTHLCVEVSRYRARRREWELVPAMRRDSGDGRSVWWLHESAELHTRGCVFVSQSTNDEMPCDKKTRSCSCRNDDGDDAASTNTNAAVRCCVNSETIRNDGDGRQCANCVTSQGTSLPRPCHTQPHSRRRSSCPCGCGGHSYCYGSAAATEQLPPGLIDALILCAESVWTVWPIVGGTAQSTRACRVDRHDWVERVVLGEHGLWATFGAVYVSDPTRRRHTTAAAAPPSSKSQALEGSFVSMVMASLLLRLVRGLCEGSEHDTPRSTSHAIYRGTVFAPLHTAATRARTTGLLKRLLELSLVAVERAMTASPPSASSSIAELCDARMWAHERTLPRLTVSLVLPVLSHLRLLRVTEERVVFGAMSDDSVAVMALLLRLLRLADEQSTAAGNGNRRSRRIDGYRCGNTTNRTERNNTQRKAAMHGMRNSVSVLNDAPYSLLWQSLPLVARRTLRGCLEHEHPLSRRVSAHLRRRDWEWVKAILGPKQRGASCLHMTPAAPSPSIDTCLDNTIAPPWDMLFCTRRRLYPVVGTTATPHPDLITRVHSLVRGSRGVEAVAVVHVLLTDMCIAPRTLDLAFFAHALYRMRAGRVSWQAAMWVYQQARHHIIPRSDSVHTSAMMPQSGTHMRPNTARDTMDAHISRVAQPAHALAKLLPHMRSCQSERAVLSVCLLPLLQLCVRHGVREHARQLRRAWVRQYSAQERATLSWSVLNVESLTALRDHTALTAAVKMYHQSIAEQTANHAVGTPIAVYTASPEAEDAVHVVDSCCPTSIAFLAEQADPVWTLRTPTHSRVVSVLCRAARGHADWQTALRVLVELCSTSPTPSSSSQRPSSLSCQSCIGDTVSQTGGNTPRHHVCSGAADPVRSLLPVYTDEANSSSKEAASLSLRGAASVHRANTTLANEGMLARCRSACPCYPRMVLHTMLYLLNRSRTNLCNTALAWHASQSRHAGGSWDVTASVRLARLLLRARRAQRALAHVQEALSLPEVLYCVARVKGQGAAELDAMLPRHTLFSLLPGAAEEANAEIPRHAVGPGRERHVARKAHGGALWIGWMGQYGALLVCGLHACAIGGFAHDAMPLYESLRALLRWSVQQRRGDDATLTGHDGSSSARDATDCAWASCNVAERVPAAGEEEATCDIETLLDLTVAHSNGKGEANDSVAFAVQKAQVAHSECASCALPKLDDDDGNSSGGGGRYDVHVDDEVVSNCGVYEDDEEEKERPLSKERLSRVLSEHATRGRAYFFRAMTKKMARAQRTDTQSISTA